MEHRVSGRGERNHTSWDQSEFKSFGNPAPYTTASFDTVLAAVRLFFPGRSHKHGGSYSLESMAVKTHSMPNSRRTSHRILTSRRTSSSRSKWLRRHVHLLGSRGRLAFSRWFRNSARDRLCFEHREGGIPTSNDNGRSEARKETSLIATALQRSAATAVGEIRSRDSRFRKERRTSVARDFRHRGASGLGLRSRGSQDARLASSLKLPAQGHHCSLQPWLTAAPAGVVLFQPQRLQELSARSATQCPQASEY